MQIMRPTLVTSRLTYEAAQQHTAREKTLKNTLMATTSTEFAVLLLMEHLKDIQVVLMKRTHMYALDSNMYRFMLESFQVQSSESH